jgi:hypothetical protein
MSTSHRRHNETAEHDAHSPREILVTLCVSGILAIDYSNSAQPTPTEVWSAVFFDYFQEFRKLDVITLGTRFRRVGISYDTLYDAVGELAALVSQAERRRGEPPIDRPCEAISLIDKAADAWR